MSLRPLCKLVFVFIFCTCACIAPAYAETFFADKEQLKADSLESILPDLEQKEKISALFWLGKHYRDTDVKHAIALLKQGLAASTSIEQLSMFHNQLGICYTLAAAYDSAELQYGKAIAMLHDNENELARLYANQGIIYKYKGEFTKSLNLHFKSLDINTRRKNEQRKMGNYINIAEVYEALYNYKNAAHYDSVAYLLAVQLKKEAAAYTILTNLSNILKHLGQYAQAKQLNRRVIRHYEAEESDTYPLANAYTGAALLHTELHRYDSAGYFVAKAVAIFRALDVPYELGSALMVLSDVALKQNNIPQAEHYGLEAYTLQARLNNKEYFRAAAQNLMKIYLRKGEVERATRYEKEAQAWADSLAKDNQAKAVIEMQTKYETQQREQENTLLKKDTELKDAKISEGNYIILSALLGIALLVFIAIVLYLRGQHRLRHNQTLQLENETLKVERLTSHLNQLKDQISPHFLFNSLSTLQGMVSEGNAQASLFVENLSQVYRYILERDSGDLVLLSEELTVAEAYIFLLKTRFEEGLTITTSFSEEALKKKLPPFSLQLLIENAVKHNAASSLRPLTIELVADETRVYVRNNRQPKRSVQESTKKGLANLQKRFMLLGNHAVIIDEQETFFRVELPLL
jgi:tetratricopeptide (TPR) repeat protein